MCTQIMWIVLTHLSWACYVLKYCIVGKGLFTDYVSDQRGGGWKMLTMADKGGIGDKANADIG